MDTIVQYLRFLTSDDDDDDNTTATDNGDDNGGGKGHASTVSPGEETTFEIYSDILLGIAFFVTAFVAGRRIYRQREQQQQQARALAEAGGGGPGGSGSGGGGGGGGIAETTVVTAFYGLIFITAMLRALWFLIPNEVWKPSYTPSAVYAFAKDHPSWVGSMFAELTITMGSLTLFSIFILILVYWADILKKYFHPGSRRMLPMVTFLTLVSILAVLELLNLILFLCRVYTTEGMILYNACLLAIVSVVCVVEITLFSHKFRTVLKTLGAINQVSTDSQVRRIVWITVTGNLFFFSRAFLELTFAITLFIFWKQNGTVHRVFTHFWWDVYTLFKYWSEVTILSLMLHILQSRFVRNQTSTANRPAAPGGGGARASPADHAAGPGPAGKHGGYTRVPDAAPTDAVVV